MNSLPSNSEIQLGGEGEGEILQAVRSWKNKFIKNQFWYACLILKKCFKNEYVLTLTLLSKLPVYEACILSTGKKKTTKYHH